MSATSLKAPVKRTGTPVMSSHPKPGVVSLEEWEANAPLSEAEIRSVSAIQKACEDKPLPIKASEDAARSRPSTPGLRQRIDAQSSSRPGTPASVLGKPVSHTYPMHPKHPIQTAQQFYDWFSAIERSVALSQESHFRDHLNEVERHLQTCDGLIENVNVVEQEVDGMLEGWRSIESGGKKLQDDCEELLSERDRLLSLADDISARLEYFQELEHATRMLNHPGESLVLQSDFLDMVERVDICIDFLQNHRQYREADIYLLRFQQCLTRAMTLIKMYFVASLKALTADISRRMADNEVSQTAQMHLLYTRFQSVATQVAPLVGELERRTLAHPDDLSSLLTECHTAYFTARRSLIIGRVMVEIKGLNPGGADLIELTRSGCSYLKQLCIDEFAIYRCFFNSGKDQLYQYLEGLCDYLYDDLRPRILHEPRLNVLCGVCRVLQALMVLDVPETESSSDEEDLLDGPRAIGNGHIDAHGLGRLHISHMLQSVLQDAQTRLFFKAQTVVQSEIRYYVPKPEDIDYPNKLAETQKQSGANEPQDREEEIALFRLSSYTKRDTWFPTLKTLLSVLSQLHEFVQLAIFDDIAQEAIDFCRLSLASAAILISSKDPSMQLDSQLFLIRHLLVLKELANNLNLGSKGSEGPLELRHIAETLTDMLRARRFLPSALASSYASVRDGAGTRENIDDDLKRTCEGVIEHCSATVVHPLRSFLETLIASQTVTSIKQKGPGQDALIAEGAFTTEKEFCRLLEKEIPEFASRLRLYLDDSGTVSVLLSHIQERIVSEYVTFRRTADRLPPPEGTTFSTSPENVRTSFTSLSSHRLS